MKNKNRFEGFVTKLFILCLIAGFATVATPLFSADAQTVTIPDANLLTALESALNKAVGADITEAELGGLRQLDARNSSITTLTGLEKATGLRSINLKGNSVSDISPVVNLPSLRLLNVENNPLNYTSLNTHIPAIESAMANRNNASVTYTARTPTTLTKVSGDSQTGELSATLANSFVVEVKDGANPAAVFAGVPVTFAVTAGGGTLSTTTVSTDATGRAETTLTLGATSVGAHTVDATVEGIADKVTFTATVSQVATTLVKISGDSQTADPGVALADAFVVEVRDQAGTAMSNVSVTFAVTAGGGTLSTTTATTGTNGQAETTLTLGTTVVGANTVEATVTGITEKITFTATANRKATTLVKISGDSQTADPGVALANAFVIEARDQSGAAMPDVSVTFSVTAGGGTLSAAAATTNASGQAETTLTLGATVVGENTVEATVAGITEKITFTATANQVATTLTKVSGDSQTSNPGAALTNAFVVEVQDQAGSAMPDVSVTFNVTAGGGTLSAAAATTNASGQAETTLTLGATVVGENTVEATVAGITEKITFTATANQVATTLTKISGDSQTSNPGAALTNAFVVEVQDQAGSAMPDVSVTFNVTAGGGTLSAAAATTNASGQAETTLTLGATVVGENTVEATVAGITEKITFTATANQVATTLVKISGDSQTGDSGTALSNAFVVEVRDQAGTAMSGVSVAFSVTAGGGTLSAASATTNASGQAEITLTLGATAGANTVEATVAGITEKIIFTATANQVATTLVKISGDSQTGDSGTALSNAFVVEVRNQAGTAMSDVSVTFAVTAGNGSLSATTATTGTNGQAETTLTLGATALTHTVEATVVGITEKATFTATATPVATSLEIISGNQQSGDPGVALANAFVVEVKNQAGTVMSNVSVAFAVTAGGGTLSASTATTGTTGRAQTTLTLGATVVGTNTVEASVTGITAKATFTATANRKATTLVVISGNNQRSSPHWKLSDALVVEVRDQAGDAMSGVDVTFRVTAGGGGLTDDTADTAGAAGAAGAVGAAGAAGAGDTTQPVPTPATTTTITSGTDGQAKVSFFLGAAAGTHTVKASVARSAAQVSFSVTGASSPLVTIPDSNLSYIINLNLRYGYRQFGRSLTSQITEADMALLGTLNVAAGSRSVSDLTGMEKAVNLRDFLSGSPPAHRFTDLSPLEDLQRLSQLTLVGNPISNISIFSRSGKFRALTYLDLSSTSVTDISSLKNLTLLQRLFLKDTSVSDISELKNLSSLRTLDLSNANVSDIPELPRSLRQLYLKGNSIKDISELLNLPILSEVSLENNPLCHRALMDHIPILKRRLGAANVTYTPSSETIHRPVFSSSSQVSVAENTATSTAFHTVIASDADTEDSITGYTLTGGADKAAFNLAKPTGALSFKVSPDYENPADSDSNNLYEVIVTATSGVDCRELDASQTITITVTDEPKPSAPAAPTVTSATATPTSLTANWAAPTSTGSAITDYDVQYREGTTGTFTNANYTGTDTNTTLTGLKAGTSYQVQVRATNIEGTSPWSASGSGTTAANAAPTFTSPTTDTFSVPENTTAVTNVTATDADADDAVTYALSGADSAAFSISTAGALTFSTAPDFENKTDVQSTDPVNAASNNVYVVKVTATGGTGARELDASKTLTVTVTDVNEPPDKPDAPTVAAATAASHNSLDVNWQELEDTSKPEVEDYDVQYREGTTGTFKDGPQTVTAKTATITGLKPNTSYQVRVRATNDEGTGPWSDAGTGKTDYQPEDVNRDDEVNVADLIAIGNHIGGTRNAAHKPDVNKDGTVNSADSRLVIRVALNNSNALTDIDGDDDVDVEDLVAFAATPVDVNGDTKTDDDDIKLIARLALNAAANRDAAPAPSQTHATLNAQNLQHLVHQALQSNRFDATYRRGVAALERILESLMIPEESALLNNYPNPFNPETWIPYQLASPAEVTLTLYDVTGRIVRTLNLGHQDAGIYRSKSRAAYWDGRNAQGEPVASGVYFYTLVAGEFTATGKMLIRK